MIYAEPGYSLAQSGGQCPPGWVVMQGERPTVEHIAQADGTWFLSSDAVVRRLLLASNSAYELATHAIAADYPQLEKDTWPTQDKESKSWVADPVNAVTPWIDHAALWRGLEREEYLRRTLAKAKQFEVISSYLTGTRQKYEDLIKAGSTPVLDYTIPLSVYAEVQSQTAQIMSRPSAELKELFSWL
jgi:hypothetical protein